MPPRALAESKELILKYAGLYCTEQELLEMARPHGLKRLSDEAGEGLASFLEKREPAWYPGAHPSAGGRKKTAAKAPKGKAGKKAAKKPGEKAGKKK